jgi:hypothetical protein
MSHNAKVPLAQRQHIVLGLRARGCTCTPVIDRRPDERNGKSKHHVVVVEHEPGCVLGDTLPENGRLF